MPLLGSVVPVLLLLSSGGGAVSAEVQSGRARPTRSSRAVWVSGSAVPRLSCLQGGGAAGSAPGRRSVGRKRVCREQRLLAFRPQRFVAAWVPSERQELCQKTEAGRDKAGWGWGGSGGVGVGAARRGGAKGLPPGDPPAVARADRVRGQGVAVAARLGGADGGPRGVLGEDGAVGAPEGGERVCTGQGEEAAGAC